MSMSEFASKADYWEAEALRYCQNADHWRAKAEASEKDSERYRKLIATGKYCPASMGGGWALLCSGPPGQKAALDAAADALPAVGDA